MANKSVPKITFNKENMAKIISDSGFSIRTLAGKIGRTDRTIRRYFSKGEMPINVFKMIMDCVHEANESKQVSEDPTSFINRKIVELTEMNIETGVILHEMNKHLNGDHPNMFDDPFDIVEVVHREVVFI